MESYEMSGEEAQIIVVSLEESGVSHHDSGFMSAVVNRDELEVYSSCLTFISDHLANILQLGEGYSPIGEVEPSQSGQDNGFQEEELNEEEEDERKNRGK